MRYPPEHKQERRDALLQTSGAVLKERGYAATGIDTLMAAAGVTSGAFYSHFASKAELFAAVVTNELSASVAMWAGNPHASAEAWVEHELDRYLSLAHVRHPEAGCVMPALGAEIARAGLEVRQHYQEELQKGVDILAARLGSEARAWAFVAQMVGALLVARAMPTRAEQEAVLHASRCFLKEAVRGARSAG